MVLYQDICWKPIKETSYKVKTNECYKVASQISGLHKPVTYENVDDVDEHQDTIPSIIDIPETLSCPAYEPQIQIQNETVPMELSTDIVDECDKNCSDSIAELPDSNTSDRPQRVRKPPGYLSDYQLS